MNIYEILKRLAFRVDPERIHHRAISIASNYPKLCSGLFPQSSTDQRLKVNVGGLTWPFPVGLAAGLDKNGEAVDFFSSLHFGAVEVGTVTPLPQEGNPRPRLHRLLEHESILNRMGFNNIGADGVLEKLNLANTNGKVLGVNIGKNKNTSENEAPNDYRLLYSKFVDIADYLVINISSPNTPGLRDFQGREKLCSILDAIKDIRKPKPLYIKVSPDMAGENVSEIASLAKEYNLQGIVATNTSVMPEYGEGGVSGKLIKDKASQIRKLVLESLRETPNIDCVGVGGIDSMEDIIKFWKQGGKVVQIYTSLIYKGPKMLVDIKKAIINLIDEYQFNDLEELIKNIDEVRTIS